MSKQSSAPISDFSSSPLARARRSVRRRSKLMRSSQSTAIVPNVFKPTGNLQELQDCRMAEWQDLESCNQSCDSAILRFCNSCSFTQLLRDADDVLVAWHRRVFERRRE